MSFGFGVGDILTISGLAVQVYSAYKDAPDDYKHISEEVRSLQTIVDGAVKHLKNGALSDSKRQEGQEALQGCQSILEDLNSLIEKYKSLESTDKKQVLKRIKLGTEDIMTLRQRLMSNTLLLTNFTRSCELIEMEARFDASLTRMLSLRRTSSKASLNSITSFASSINTKTAYKKLCRDLHQNGVTADMINRKERQILDVFQSRTVDSGQNVRSQSNGVPVPTGSTLTENGSSSTRNQIRSRPRWARPPMDFLFGPAMLAAAVAGDTKRLTNTLRNIRDIDFVDDSKETALLKAAWEGHNDIVRLLLNNGASIKVINRHGSTPLHIAVLNSDADMVQLFLEQGASINAINKDSNTPLHFAATKGYAPIVELLLKEGSSVETIGQFGRTPLHNAAKSGHIDTVQLLLQEGASMEAIDKYGYTPLHLAVLNGHTGAVQRLLEKGAPIGALDKYSSTPLHLAAYSGHIATVQLLLEKGAFIEAINEYDSTPLHYAAKYDHTATVQLLLEKGADIEAMDTNKFTPLHLAARHGRTDTVQLLLDNGASNTSMDENNVTPSSHDSYSIVLEN